MINRTEAAVTDKLDMHKLRAPALEFVQTLMTVRLLAILVQLDKI